MKKITLNKKIENEYRSYVFTISGGKLNIEIEEDGDVENETISLKVGDIIAQNASALIVESKVGGKEINEENSEFKETPLDVTEKNRIANEWLTAA